MPLHAKQKQKSFYCPIPYRYTSAAADRIKKTKALEAQNMLPFLAQNTFRKQKKLHFKQKKMH